MNDSEAACFSAEALEYHCSVCDFVRLAVRPVNSDFDIFIRILFYQTKSDEKTQGNSLDYILLFLGGGGAFEPKQHGLLCGHRLKSICVRF